MLRSKMVTSFIVTKDGKIYFDLLPHSEIAEKYGVSSDQVRGGGFAILNEKKIFGKSGTFGPYNKEDVKNALSNGESWQIE